MERSPGLIARLLYLAKKLNAARKRAREAKEFASNKQNVYKTVSTLLGESRGVRAKDEAKRARNYARQLFQNIKKLRNPVLVLLLLMLAVKLLSGG